MPAHGSFLLVLATASLVAAAPAAYAVDPMTEPGDTSAPATSVVAVVPGEVTVTDEAAAVVVTARVTDSGTGVSAVSVRLDEGAPVALSPLSGDARNGEWSGSATIPHAAPHGLVTAVVEARDGAGNTSRYTQVAARVADAAPAAPSAVAATVAGSTLNVTWEAPPANGASPADGYTVSAEPVSGAPAVVVETAAREASLPGLADGRYVVRVAAHNAAGTGPDALADATVGATVATATPSAPRDLRAVPRDAALDVTWAAVEGATAYDIHAAGSQAAPLRVAGTVATLPGLANGVAHDVVVTPVNDAGTGLAAHVRATPRRAPGAPVLGAVTGGDRSATVRWVAPYDGGDAIHTYVVTARPSGRTYVLPGTARSAVVGGLVNGTAVAFGITARNDAGTGPASPASPPVTPRQPIRISIGTRPAAAVTYGTGSNASARLTTVAGTALPGVRVELQGRLRPSTTWRVLASGVTDSLGVVRLRTVLPVTADLRLRHPGDALAEAYASLGTVAVSPKVSAVAKTSIPMGSTLTVTGSVAPAQRAGDPVLLQRWGATGWANVARGAMTTTTAYRVAWKPGSSGVSALRVVKPADVDHAAGASTQWRQEVIRQQTWLARQIKAISRISLDTRHVSGRVDGATARANIVDLAAGYDARRSSYEGAPGGRTPVDPRLLRALLRMGERGGVTVSEIAGGSHSRNSTHYSGRGLDIRMVNGVPVRRGSGYWLAVDACRAFGAVRVFHPSYDPYGGHQGHVHCDW